MSSICFMFAMLVVAVSAGTLPQKTAMDRIFTANQRSSITLEGDIVDNARSRVQIMMMKAAGTGKFIAYDAQNSGKWANGVVPYDYSNLGYQARAAVDQAVREYSTKTCVKFVKRTNERDYLSFVRKSGCYSQIGHVGGRQEVSLGNGCEHKSVAIHEMMHAIGFYHEQSRRDRDNYVTVYYQNMQQGMSYNFEKYRQGAASTYSQPYDKKSVMHYSRNSFSVNGQPTIVSKSNYNEVLGNTIGFSQIDINQINLHYNCGTNPSTRGPITQGPRTQKPVTWKPQTWRPQTWAPNTWGPTICKDNNSLCPHWKNHCRSSQYVIKNCKKSCRFCY